MNLSFASLALILAACHEPDWTDGPGIPVYIVDTDINDFERELCDEAVLEGISLINEAAKGELFVLEGHSNANRDYRVNIKCVPLWGKQGNTHKVTKNLELMRINISVRIEPRADVVMHELGHAVGLEHKEGTFMALRGKLTNVDSEQSEYLQSIAGE